MKARDPMLFLDPHNCWSSCSVPGDNCLACTNPSYFSCPLSGVCIHPDLQCDGHPQCQFAEDEGFEDCKKKYYEKKIIEEFATVKCNSTVYPMMITVATACNGVVECLMGEDEEPLCSDNISSTIILVGTCFAFLSIYLGLRFSHIMNLREGEVMEDSKQMINTPMEKSLENYQNDHDDQENIDAVKGKTIDFSVIVKLHFQL